MISNEEIKEFLEGGDPEQFIVSIEFDYVTDAIYKIKEVPNKGKQIIKDNFIKHRSEFRIIHPCPMFFSSVVSTLFRPKPIFIPPGKGSHFLSI